MTLEQEMATYEREKPRLLAEGGEGKFVLIKGRRIEGTFPTRAEGLRVGYERFGVGTPFLLHEIQVKEEPVAIFTPFFPKCHT